MIEAPRVETGRVVLGAVRQAEGASVQRGVPRGTVYSTFRVPLQKTLTARGRAPIVRRTVTAPPEHAPVVHLPPLLEA